MKIHIVQKGDTLTEIASMYDVEYEELVQQNSHVSSPDLIMPGMKIKIPSDQKQVKQKTNTPSKQKKSKEEKVLEKPPKQKIQKKDNQTEDIKQEEQLNLTMDLPKLPVTPQLSPHESIINIHAKEKNLPQEKSKNKQKITESKKVPMQEPMMPMVLPCCPCCGTIAGHHPPYQGAHPRPGPIVYPIQPSMIPIHYINQPMHRPYPQPPQFFQNEKETSNHQQKKR